MWKTQTMAVTGRGHIQKDLPCQDRTYAMEENGVTVIALADGAGSASLSQEGAEQAVKTVCHQLCARFEELYDAPGPQMVRYVLLSAVREAVAARAAELGVQARQLASTLLAVAVKDERFLLLHVGDGVIGCRKAGKLLTLSAPENGEFSNTTVFVTSNAALTRAVVRKGRQTGVEGFLLMSDGCEAALYQKQKQRLAPVLHKTLERCQLFTPAAAEEALRPLLACSVAGRTFDDCSLAMMTRPVGRFGDWARMQPRQRAALLGITTRNKAKRRRQIRQAAAHWLET